MKKICILLITALLLEQVAWAAPDFSPSKAVINEKQKIELGIPESVATIEDVYIARHSERSEESLRRIDPSSPAAPQDDVLIYLIQDAHTNESGQLNLAKTLDILLQKEDGRGKMEDKLRYVFTEAAVGDNSLAFLRPYRPLEERRKLARHYIRKGLLHGTEYLDLTSEHTFTLWGVEDPKLYIKSLEDYKQVAKERERFDLYLKKIEATLGTLKERFYGPGLMRFDKDLRNFQDEKLSLTDYFSVLTRESALLNISLSDYPHLKNLQTLKDKEAKIDFKKANDEQLQAIQSLSEADRQELNDLTETESATKTSADPSFGGNSPFKLSSRDQKGERAFYAVLEEKIRNRHSERSEESPRRIDSSLATLVQNDVYLELFKYFDYLRLAKQVEAKGVLEELKNLEDRILDSYAKTEDEKLLVKSSKLARLYEKLFHLTLTPEEYQEYLTLSGRHPERSEGSLRRIDSSSTSSPQNDGSFGIEHLTGFLNKKIMDLGTYYERSLFLEKGYQDIARHAEDFYELTSERDSYFIDEMLKKMDKAKSSSISQDSRVAVLVTGGFHTANLKAILKKKGVSYISITPQVLRETNMGRYEELLLNQKVSAVLPPQTLASKMMTGHALSQGIPSTEAAKDALKDIAGKGGIKVLKTRSTGSRLPLFDFDNFPLENIVKEKGPDQDAIIQAARPMVEDWYRDNRRYLSLYAPRILQYPLEGEQYRRNELYRSDVVGVYAHVWGPHGTTRLHNHAGQIGFIIPMTRGLQEESFEFTEDPGSEPLEGRVFDLKSRGIRDLEPGKLEIIKRGRGSIHRVWNTTGLPVIVVEIYVRPFGQVFNPVPVEGEEGRYYFRDEAAVNIRFPLGEELMREATLSTPDDFLSVVSQVHFPVYTTDGTAILSEEAAKSYLKEKNPQVFMSGDTYILKPFATTLAGSRLMADWQALRAFSLRPAEVEAYQAMDVRWASLPNNFSQTLDESNDMGLILPLLKDLSRNNGLLSTGFPENVGGLGQNAVAEAMVNVAVTKHNPSAALIVDVLTALTGWILFTFGTEAQKEKYLKPLLKGDLLFVFGLTEPGAGSDNAGMTTSAYFDPKTNEWVLNGLKQWITVATRADHAVIFAKVVDTQGEAPKPDNKRFTAFIVPLKNDSHVVVGPMPKNAGYRGTGTATISLTDVRVPKDHVLGEVGEGAQVFKEALAAGRISISAIHLGFLEKAFEEVIKSDQGATARSEELMTDAYATYLLLIDAARQKDREEDYGLAAAMVKLKSSEDAMPAIVKAMEALGPASLEDGHPLERIFRDSLLGKIGEGTSEIMRSKVIGPLIAIQMGSTRQKRKTFTEAISENLPNIHTATHEPIQKLLSQMREPVEEDESQKTFRLGVLERRVVDLVVEGRALYLMKEVVDTPGHPDLADKLYAAAQKKALKLAEKYTSQTPVLTTTLGLLPESPYDPTLAETLAQILRAPTNSAKDLNRTLTEHGFLDQASLAETGLSIRDILVMIAHEGGKLLIQKTESYAAQRRAFGKAIAEFPLVQEHLSDARKIHQNLADSEEPALDLMRIADHAIQVHGGTGFAEETGLTPIRDLALNLHLNYETQVVKRPLSDETLAELVKRETTVGITYRMREGMADYATIPVSRIITFDDKTLTVQEGDQPYPLPRALVETITPVVAGSRFNEEKQRVMLGNLFFAYMFTDSYRLTPEKLGDAVDLAPATVKLYLNEFMQGYKPRDFTLVELTNDKEGHEYLQLEEWFTALDLDKARKVFDKVETYLTSGPDSEERNQAGAYIQFVQEEILRKLSYKLAFSDLSEFEKIVRKERVVELHELHELDGRLKRARLGRYYLIQTERFSYLIYDGYEYSGNILEIHRMSSQDDARAYPRRGQPSFFSDATGSPDGYKKVSRSDLNHTISLLENNSKNRPFRWGTWQDTERDIAALATLGIISGIAPAGDDVYSTIRRNRTPASVISEIRSIRQRDPAVWGSEADRHYRISEMHLLDNGKFGINIEQRAASKTSVSTGSRLPAVTSEELHQLGLHLGRGEGEQWLRIKYQTRSGSEMYVTSGLFEGYTPDLQKYSVNTKGKSTKFALDVKNAADGEFVLLEASVLEKAPGARLGDESHISLPRIAALPQDQLSRLIEFSLIPTIANFKGDRAVFADLSEKTDQEPVEIGPTDRARGMAANDLFLLLKSVMDEGGALGITAYGGEGTTRGSLLQELRMLLLSTEDFLDAKPLKRPLSDKDLEDLVKNGTVVDITFRMRSRATDIATVPVSRITGFDADFLMVKEKAEPYPIPRALVDTIAPVSAGARLPVAIYLANVAEAHRSALPAEIAVSLKDDRPTVFRMNLSKVDGVDVLYVQTGEDQAPVAIHVQEVLRDADNRPVAVKISTGDLVTMARQRDTAIHSSLAELVTLNTEQKVLVQIDAEILGDISQDPTVLALLALQAYAKRNLEPMKNVRYVINTPDLSLRVRIDDFLSDLEKQHQLKTNGLRDLFIASVPADHQVVEMVSPQAVARVEGHRYIPVEPTTPGDVVSFPLELAAVAGRVDLEGSLDGRFVRAYSWVLGTLVDAAELKDVLQGVATLSLFIKYALKPLAKVDLNAVFRWSQQMARQLASSA